jgi:hypothetical protein
MTKATGAAITAIILVSPLFSGCSSEPSTQVEVCTTFGELGAQVLRGNGIFGNPLFHKADELSDVAKRYKGADLSGDAAALHRIAGDDSTSGVELMNATTHIAQLCGHRLLSR